MQSTLHHIIFVKGMKRIVSILKENKSRLKTFSLLIHDMFDVEVAGDFVFDPFDSLEIVPTANGTSKGVTVNTYIPLLHDRIGWCTHPKNVIPGNEEFETNHIFAVPSEVDLIGTIKTSLFYSKEEIHQSIGAILGKEGIFLYGPSQSFLQLLIEDKHKKKIILDIGDIVEKITMTSRLDSPQLSESENAFRFIKSVQTYTKSKYPDMDKDGNKSIESSRVDELVPSAFELVYIPFDKRTKPKTKKNCTIS